MVHDLGKIAGWRFEQQVTWLLLPRGSEPFIHHHENRTLFFTYTIIKKKSAVCASAKTQKANQGYGCLKITRKPGQIAAIPVPWKVRVSCHGKPCCLNLSLD